jgi:hypothetical protein
MLKRIGKHNLFEISCGLWVVSCRLYVLAGLWIERLWVVCYSK